MRKITLLLSLVFATIAMAQVTTVPAIIQKGYDGKVTIIFNPNEGNKGMVDATECYAHTGIITKSSTNDGDWKYVVDAWCGKAPKTKMTKKGENWVLKIDTLSSYYGCPVDEIEKLAFVFNDGVAGDGGKQGKTAENTDIFVDLVEPGLAASIVSDLAEISEIGEVAILKCYALDANKMTLKVNGVEVKSTTELEMEYSQVLDKAGKYNFELIATNGTETKTATAFTWVPSTPIRENRPTGIVNGIYYDEEDSTKVTLCTYAAAKLTNTEKKAITIKAKLPSHWTNTISAYTWTPGVDGTGKFVKPEREDEWYVVTETKSEMNIIFVNGEDWNGDSNQTEDIRITSNTNIQVTQSGSAKAKYTVLGRDIEVKAKMPTHWTNTISAKVSVDGGAEKVVIPEMKDGWYVLNENGKAVSVAFANGNDWSTPANHTATIEVMDNVLLQVSQADTEVGVCNILIADPAKHVFVVGDFNNWTISDEYQLKQANDSAYFWIEIKGLEPQKEYTMQYVVVRADGVVKRISDLYSEKVLHPDDKYEPQQADPDLMDYPMQGDGYVTVIQTNKPEYQWSEATLNFQRPDKNNLVIYELWVYDYTPERTLAAVMERMDYFVSLGVNAIELMPVTEFDGNYNWGYSPNHYFAFDKAYGTPNDLKAFVDTCHSHGIAVIVDMVFNHATGLNPMNKLYPYGEDLAYNPWFNVTAPHSDNVYEDWNHDFAPTKTMFTRALQYWLKEYKVDGFRMDLSHGLCGTTNNAMTHIADYYNNGVKSVSDDAYFILEHWGANMGSDRPALVNQGMMCWENTNDAYRQVAAGYTSSSFSNANKLGYVSYCESHDEERMQYQAKTKGAGNLKSSNYARVKRVGATVAFNVLLAGPHMIWQFEEIGYDFSINSSASSPNGTSSDNRCATKPRPESMGYFADVVRVGQFVKIAQAIQLRTKLMKEQFLQLKKPTKVDIGGKALRTIQWGNDVFVAGNFSVDKNQDVTIPEGTWYNYYKQSPQTENILTLTPGEFIILTGTPVEAPVIGNELVGVENVEIDGSIELLPPYNVQVYSINGQLISSQKNVMDADLTGMRAGVYIVQYEKNGQRVAKKIIR